MSLRTRDDTHAQKRVMRQELRRVRNRFVTQLDGPSKGLAFRAIPSPLHPLFENAEVIALYAATSNEAPTGQLARRCLELGKRVCFPCVQPSGPLLFREMRAQDLLVEESHVVPELDPEAAVLTPDVIVAPLVAFDSALNRLGQGGGHYDRTFAAHPEAVRIGLAWSVQQVDQVPSEEHDVGLQYVVTENALFEGVRLTS